ncbi:MAG TPA: hypothetical protein VFS64_04565 [Solirubrobacterales bacterium]|nr:hypothetical protein [Solirubrobacterales bacterium]
MGSFSFPFYGTTHTGSETIGVSSNGLLVFNGEDTDNTPSGLEAETGLPKIAALWADLNPSNLPPDQGSVWLNTFNEDADPAVDRLVFTWDSQFFGCENVLGCRALVQVQLFDTGRIVFGYNGVLSNQPPTKFVSPLMPVIAKGGVVLQPGFELPPPGTDYSETLPFNGGDLIFEEFSGRPIHFDLDQNNLIFEPAGPDSYHVTSSVPFRRPQGGPAAPLPVDKTPPNVKLSVTKRSLDKVLAKGLALQLQCNEACFSEVTVGSKSPKVKSAGSAAVEIEGAGKRKVTVELNRAAHAALEQVSKATLKVTATTFDEAGNKKVTSKKVKLK